MGIIIHTPGPYVNPSDTPTPGTQAFRRLRTSQSEVSGAALYGERAESRGRPVPRGSAMLLRMVKLPRENERPLLSVEAAQ